MVQGAPCSWQARAQSSEGAGDAETQSPPSRLLQSAEQTCCPGLHHLQPPPSKLCSGKGTPSPTRSPNTLSSPPALISLVQPLCSPQILRSASLLQPRLPAKLCPSPSTNKEKVQGLHSGDRLLSEELKNCSCHTSLGLQRKPSPFLQDTRAGVAGEHSLLGPRRVPPEVPLDPRTVESTCGGSPQKPQRGSKKGQESAGPLEGHRGRRWGSSGAVVRIGPPSLRPTHCRLPPLEMAKPTADEEAAFLLLLP